MTDAAYENAVKRREALENEMKSLSERTNAVRSELARVERFMADWKVFSGAVDFESVASSQPATAMPTPRMRPKNPPKEEVGDRAAELIRAVGRPLSRPELFDRLKGAGVILHGKDPAVVLSTMLWRMKDRFVTLPGYGYWLRSQPYAPADYDPTQRDLEDLLGVA